MKKLIQVLIISSFIATFFISCGPSAEEKAAAEQHVKDSIAMAEQAIQDSIMAVQQKATEDSLAAVKAVEDSLAMVKAIEDSIAAAKPKPKAKPKAQPKADVPKVGNKKPGAN
jgi:hypothetical protein